MKDLIKKKLREDLEISHVDNATKDKFIIGEDEEENIFIRAREGGIKKYNKMKS